MEFRPAIKIAILTLYIFIERCRGVGNNDSIINGSYTGDGFVFCDDLMNKDKFQTIVKEIKYEELFNPNQNFSCQYYTEDEFIIKNRNGDKYFQTILFFIKFHRKKLGGGGGRKNICT